MLAARYKKTCLLLLGLIIVYLAQSVLIAPDKTALAKYDISAGQAKILVLTIALPYVLVWIIALAGYLRFASYVSAIKASKDGMAFQTIARAILVFTFWLPVSAIITNFCTQYYTNHPAATANLIRFNNYANLILLSPAFYWMYRGSHQLLPLIKRTTDLLSQRANLLFISFTALYVFLVLHDPARRFPTGTVPIASYYEPDWLVTLSITIPRLITWYLGFQAILNIYLYQQKIRGSLYKAALKNLVVGLMGIVVMIIALRGLQSLSATLAEFNLGGILVLIYVLLILLGASYALVARGASSLQKLEDL